MSTALPTPHVGAESQQLAGTLTLLRFSLRRDRMRLAAWALGVGGMTVYAAIVLNSTYPTATDRQGRAALMSNPAAIMLGGPGYGTDDYTLGAMVANELGLSVMVAVAIMSILLVVRHTRAEEESGRAELVRAGVVGRRAALTSALALVAVANGAIAVVVAAGLSAAGLATIDSIAFAVGIAATGLVFGATAAVAAQVTEYARAASGIALGLLGIAAVVRGVGDVDRHGGSTLSWFSPIAWAQQTRAYVDLRWWPLLPSVALVAVLVTAAYRLVDRRDVDAGLFPARSGAAHASARLNGPLGLTLRLQRTSIVSWAIALVLLGLTFGSLTDAVVDMVETNPQLASMLEATGGSASAAFSAVVALDLSLAVAAGAVAAVLRLRSEETSGHVEVLLATSLDRRRLLGGDLTVIFGAAVLWLIGAGLGTGVAAAAVSGDGGRVGSALGTSLVPLPAVLVVAAAAAALVACAPRRSYLAWVILGWVVLVGLFGAVLGPPEWVLRLSPFGWTPAVPAEDLSVTSLTVQLLVAAALVALALAGFRRRDLPT